MGYTTQFSGSLNLSRTLTLPEAKELMEIYDADGDDVRGPRRANDGATIRTQWVPTESLDAIVWDGGEKFYDYTECLKWTCAWLHSHGIEAAGEIAWSGEEASDHGHLIVIANHVEEHKHMTKAQHTGRPLTMSKLGLMALEHVSSAPR